MFFMGWGSREGGNNFNFNYFQISAAARGWKFRISYLSLVLLRDAEKETHKHKVLWELVKTRGRKRLCTLNRVGVSVKNVIVIFLLKSDQLLIFSVFHGVGVTVGVQQ